MPVSLASYALSRSLEQNASARVVDSERVVSLREMSQQKPRHPLRLSQYELNAFLHALPDPMLAAFASTYDVPAQAQDFVHKRTPRPLWAPVHTARLQFLVKWCLTTTSDFGTTRGQPALQQYLALCIETAFDAPCVGKTPLENGPLRVDQRLQEARQREIVTLVRDTNASLASAHHAHSEATASVQPDASSIQSAPSSPGPALPQAVCDSFDPQPMLTEQSLSRLAELQHALVMPTERSAVAAHVHAHTALARCAAQLRRDLSAGLEAQQAAIWARQQALVEQQAVFSQQEAELIHASEDIKYDMWKCEEAAEKLDELRCKLQG